MKKIYSIICTLCIVNCALIQAQSIEIMREGAAFAMISPNSKYIAGNISDKTSGLQENFEEGNILLTLILIILNGHRINEFT